MSVDGVDPGARQLVLVAEKECVAVVLIFPPTAGVPPKKQLWVIQLPFAEGASVCKERIAVSVVGDKPFPCIVTV